MAFSFLLLRQLAICLLSMAVVSATSLFLQSQTKPGWEWKIVGYLDMTDPTQRCPNSWQSITSPRSSCGKKTNDYCDSLTITTSGPATKRCAEESEVISIELLTDSIQQGASKHTTWMGYQSPTGHLETDITYILIPLVMRKRITWVAVHVQGEIDLLSLWV